MKNVLIFIVMVFCFLSCKTSENNKPVKAIEKDTLITLKNQFFSLKVSLFGGAFIDFRFIDSDINPLSFKLTTDEMPPNNRKGAPFQGHFICLGRWGAPTPGEIEEGVPHNGQVTNTMWTREKLSDNTKLIMSNYAPRDGMVILRTIKISDSEPLFFVTEEIKNATTICRINNVVQHVTLAPPFLDETTLVNTNAGKGFLQALSYPNPHQYEFQWPIGYLDENKTKVDMSLSTSKQSYCATFLFTDEYGWVTATNPAKGLLIGYLWKTADYPFINIWHEVKDNKPWAKGIEFGTTGIGRSYQDLLAVDTRFHGRNSFELLDAGQAVTKSYVAFLAKVNNQFNGVEKIEFKNGKIIIIEKGTKNVTELKFEGFNR